MFPFVRYVKNLDSNGTNILGLVILRRGLQYPAAVLAQEAWESMHKQDPVKLFYRIFRRSDEDQREFEYMGHECEVQAARIIYGLDAATYRRAEAVSMHSGYDGLFRRMTITDLVGEMRARRHKAIDWADDNLRHLLKHKDGKP